MNENVHILSKCVHTSYLPLFTLSKLLSALSVKSIFTQVKYDLLFTLASNF